MTSVELAAVVEGVSVVPANNHSLQNVNVNNCYCEMSSIQPIKCEHTNDINMLSS